MNLWTIFVTGLFTGGLTCLAVQGGLLAATLANRQEDRLREKSVKTGNALPILTFVISKLIAYTILGFLLGWFGSLFQLSLTTKVVMQLLVAVFMIGSALNLLDVYPIFRYFVIQPPKFITRRVRNEAKSASIFAPVVLGALTIFIPCGTTQAMMALAIGSGNPITGATILFAFILGTSPLFFILGYLTTRLSGSLNQKFMKVTALAILILAVFNINNTIALTGNTTLDTYVRDFICTAFSACNESAQAISNVKGVTATSNPTIYFESGGYNPKNITVSRGQPVTLHLVNNTGSGCIQSFTIPKLNVEKVVRVGTSDTVEFTAPNSPQEIAFMCGMGMYRGTINVI